MATTSPLGDKGAAGGNRGGKAEAPVSMPLDQVPVGDPEATPGFDVHMQPMPTGGSSGRKGYPNLAN